PGLRLQDLFEPFFLLQAIDRCDDVVVQLPMSGIMNLEIPSIDAEIIDLKLLRQFLLPLHSKTRRRNEKDSTALSTLPQGRQQHPDFDGFSQADVIGNHPVQMPGAEDPVDQMDLMR